MIDHASLLPLYAAGGTPLLVLIAELATGKRAVAAASVLLGGVATIV
jgi:NADH-quinone oxidoreductase subunit N